MPALDLQKHAKFTTSYLMDIRVIQLFQILNRLDLVLETFKYVDRIFPSVPSIGTVIS